MPLEQGLIFNQFKLEDMKRLMKITTIFIILLFAASCQKDILDRTAVDSFTEESVFSDLSLTNAFVGYCYRMLGGGDGIGNRISLIANATDESYTVRADAYPPIKGTLSPDDMGGLNKSEWGWLNWQTIYADIQRVNMILANIDKVPTKSAPEEAKLASLKGEAYFLRAWCYMIIATTRGGAVLIDKPFKLGDDYSTITRSSLKDTRDFILKDVDAAIASLPKTRPNAEQGRATQAAAAAIKSRLLLFCASKLVNGGYKPTEQLISLTDGTQSQRWQDAKKAAKDIIDGTYGTFSLTGTTNDPPSPLTEADVKAYSDNYTSIFNQTGVWNKEVLWGWNAKNATGYRWRINIYDGPNGYHNWGTNNSPTEETVRTYFEMADGTPFVWDKYTPGNQLVRSTTAAELAADPNKNPFNGREPRFYSCILYHGSKWQARPTDMAGIDPVGVIQSGYFIAQDGTVTPGLDTRQTTVENWNGTETGYYVKKFMNINVVGQYYDNEDAWIEFRYAEILLNYAEACIELGEIQEGVNYLNMVRNRAGLPDRATADQAEARTYVRHERSTEFIYEGHRWWDMRRWMIAPDVLHDIHHMKVSQYWNGDFEWEWVITTNVQLRTWNDKCYWVPIARDEINRAPQLQQTPGY